MSVRSRALQHTGAVWRGFWWGTRLLLWLHPPRKVAAHTPSSTALDEAGPRLQDRELYVPLHLPNLLLLPLHFYRASWKKKFLRLKFPNIRNYWLCWNYWLCRWSFQNTTAITQPRVFSGCPEYPSSDMRRSRQKHAEVTAAHLAVTIANCFGTSARGPWAPLRILTERVQRAPCSPLRCPSLLLEIGRHKGYSEGFSNPKTQL